MKYKYLWMAVLVVLFPILGFIFSLIILSNDELANIISDLQSSLNDYPLADLEYLSSCDSSDYLNSLFTWPGTVLGCTCADVTRYRRKQTNKHKVFPGSCSRNQTLNGCLSVPAVDSMKLNTWKNGKFCSKKYEVANQTLSIGNYSTLLNNSVLEKETCKNGYKKCGKLDNLGNYLCYPENEECPINDIIFSNTIREDLPDYKNTTYNGNYIYYTNKAIDKPVITKLRAVEKKLCADKLRYYTEFPQFILDRNFEYYGCKSQFTESLYDNSFSPLDNILKEDFYNQNQLNLQYFFKPQDEFPFQSLAAQMTLYPKLYSGFNKQCLIENGVNMKDSKLFQDEDFKKTTNCINNTRIAMWVLFGFSIADFIIFIFFSSFLSVNYDTSSILIFDGAVFLFYLGMLIPTFIGFSYLNDVHYFPECGDSITNEKIEYFNDGAYVIWKEVLIILILLALQIVVMIVCNFLYFCENCTCDNPFRNLFRTEQRPEYRPEEKQELDNKVEEPKVPEVPYYQKEENVPSEISNIPTNPSNPQLDRTPTGSVAAPPAPMQFSGTPQKDNTIPPTTPQESNISPAGEPQLQGQPQNAYSYIPPTVPPTSLYANISPSIPPTVPPTSVYANIPPSVPPSYPSEQEVNVDYPTNPNDQNQINVDYPPNPQ